MSEKSMGTPGTGDEEALAHYLGLSREVQERLQLLREEVHASLNDEFHVVADDLEQLRSILTDAAQKLSGAFRVISQSTEDLNQALARIAKHPADDSLVMLNEIADGMNATAGTTIQSLQFEDMATQLLAHVNRRLKTVHDFSVEMSVVNPTASRTPPFLTPEELDSLFARLEYYRNELRVSTRKVVQQQSLDSGDIELF
jgi:methyl-accepting chemotaxis protein